MMEVLIGCPGCKAISSLGQHVEALNQVIFYFPGGTKGGEVMDQYENWVQNEIWKENKKICRKFNFTLIQALWRFFPLDSGFVQHLIKFKSALVQFKSIQFKGLDWHESIA